MTPCMDAGSHRRAGSIPLPCSYLVGRELLEEITAERMQQHAQQPGDTRPRSCPGSRCGPLAWDCQRVDCDVDRLSRRRGSATIGSAISDEEGGSSALLGNTLAPLDVHHERECAPPSFQDSLVTQESETLQGTFRETARRSQTARVSGDIEMGKKRAAASPEPPVAVGEHVEITGDDEAAAPRGRAGQARGRGEARRGARDQAAGRRRRSRRGARGCRAPALASLHLDDGRRRRVAAAARARAVARGRRARGALGGEAARTARCLCAPMVGVAPSRPSACSAGATARRSRTRR